MAQQEGMMEDIIEKPKILIVDDHAEEIYILREELHSDYDIFAATDGHQALLRVASNPPDLILLDVVMPGMSGHEVCRQLKANHKTHNIPIIFITAKGEEQDETEGFALGASDYISKPFRLAVVRARVETILGLKREMDLREELAGDLQKLNEQLEDRVDEQVAKLQLADVKLRTSEATLRVVLENILDLVFITDDFGNFTFICANLPNIIKYSVAELEAMGNVAKLIPDSLTYLEDFGKAGVLHDLERVIVDKDGNARDFLINVNSVPFMDGTRLWTCREITERKKLESRLRQSYKMEAIGTLAGGIAHDFNNILSAIVGYTEISIGAIGSESPVKQYLSRVMEACTRAKDLVKHILMFSRETEQEPRPLNIALPVKEALRLIRASVPATIEIRQDIRARAPVLADPTQMHQLVMNLCTNAAHAMRETGGVLSIQLADETVTAGKIAEYPDLTPGLYVKITVSDTGHGIPSQNIDRIFDPFFTTKEKAEGTGMGLSVVHGIVQGHGGSIFVKSQVGRGSTFDIFLPTLEGNSEEAEEARKLSVQTGNESILFIDDEEMIADIAKAMLEGLGYSAVTKMNASEALTLFRQGPDAFDLVITDLTMPQLTGFDLAERIHRIRPDIPIVLCTGFGLDFTEETAAKYGISGIIFKPILRRNMAEVIRNVLDGGDPACLAGRRTREQ